MPKEWVLNSANMRWGLNKKKQVGAVAEEIRKCSPKNIKDWEDYYYKKEKQDNNKNKILLERKIAHCFRDKCFFVNIKNIA